MALLRESEKFVLRRALEWLAMASVPAWRNNTGQLEDAHGRPVKFGKIGSGDIIGVIPGPGTHFECECKNEIRKQSTAQETHQKIIEKAGGIYLVLRPSNFILELEKNIATRLPISTADLLKIRRRLGVEGGAKS